MKIALIDNGVSENAFSNKIEVRHFSLVNGELAELYKPPKDKHGTHCFNEIMANIKNNDLQILDMNISDESENIQVASIISAMKKAIKERVDVINVSLGTATYSQELYNVCEEACKNNIVILSASSHKKTISFPADFNNVVCVQVDQEQAEIIKVVGATTISVSMRDYIITENGIEFDFSSSSMACARACGYLSNALYEEALNDKFTFLSKRYNIDLRESDALCSEDVLEESEIKSILSTNRVAIVLFPCNAIESVDIDILHENIVAYYDYEKNGFFSFKDGKKAQDFEVIMLLNTLHTNLRNPIEINEEFQRYRIIYIGNFCGADDNSFLYNYDKCNTSEMAVLDRPIIAIAGLCSGLNKSDVQISLLHKMREDGLNIKAVSNNPIGLLYSMDVFNYPNEIRFPEIVYSINNYMYLNEVKEEFDAWLINIGGAVGPVNNLNTYNFGKLADAYFSAANIDVAVMCVNTSVDVNNLNLQLANLYKNGINYIFVVLSHNDIDAATMDYKDGVQTYYVDNKKYLEAFEYLKKNIREKVYTLEEVYNGKLYESIIQVLS